MSAPQLPSADILFENAACGLLLTDINGTIRATNITFCRWLGYRKEELIDRFRLQQMFTMGGKVFHHTHWAPLLQMQGSVAEVQMDMVHREGHTIPMLINAVRRKHDNHEYNELAFFIATDRRKYERELLLARQSAESSLEELHAAQLQLRQLNEQLSLADRRKDEFLATLAHELRNPMAPIRNVLEILKLKDLRDPQLQWGIGALERQTQQMTHLVDDLMEISRITQGRVELRKQALDFLEIVQNAVEVVRPAIAEADHQLSIELPEETIIVDADATRVTQVITNLLTNAAKYTPAGGKVSVQVKRQGQEVMLAVRDTGIGIPPQELNNVFQMFSQLTPALERSKGGLGIGLALVRGLVELHGGSIKAESAGLGQGSTFVVRLPLSEHHDAQQDSTPPFPTARKSRRILIVDDNVDAAESLALTLSMLGDTINTAHSGLDGLAKAEASLPEVMLLDIGLPGCAQWIACFEYGGKQCAKRALPCRATLQQHVGEARMHGQRQHLPTCRGDALVHIDSIEFVQQFACL